MAVGLYFHIPFCMRKCPYCDFYSLVFSEEMQDEFTAAVVRNILSCGGESVDTIYFGGGTPSLLSAESYVKIFKAISDNFKLESPEISLEANPGTIDYNKLKRLRELGFNRISFGVQSLSDNELSALGRIHTSAQAENAVILAKSAGFENISADIILGLIGQDENSLSSTIDRLCSLPVSHISAYMLKIEKNTPFNSPEIIRQLPDDEKTADIYLFAAEKLEKNGFLQYEISNFSKPGLECRHNLKYWRCEEYIGIGPSAHSYFNNKRYFSPPSLDDFVFSKIQREIITEEKPHSFEEAAMLTLRLSEGLSKKVCDEFGIDFFNMAKKAAPLKKSGLVKITNDKIMLTKAGFLVSNTVIFKLIHEI